MSFSEQSLSAQLTGLLPGDSRGGRLVVAFSGGLDSCVLLHVMHRLQHLFPNRALAAIHVNHGLSRNADAWQAFCEKICAQLAIPLQVVRVQIDRDAGASLENLAREKRYEAFSRALESGDCLLMAHHLDDQAETFLLRTLRGAGPRGLAAMPVSRRLGKGVLIRPLLSFSRQDLEQWAVEQQLQSIDDESNADVLFDRNYCRHNVLPLIASRWPGYRESWLRSAQLCAEADGLLEELAAQDFANVSTTDPAALRCAGLMQLSDARQRNLLRYWLREAGAADPGWNVLARIVSEVVAAASDAQPLLGWQSGQDAVEVRRHGGMLHLLRVCPAPDIADTCSWSPPDTLSLAGNGSIHAAASECGLRILEGQQLILRYRQGGEECRLAGRPKRALKKILQEAGIAPWLRERLPLVYVDDELVCIPGVGVCEGWLAKTGEPAWDIVWTPPSHVLSTRR